MHLRLSWHQVYDQQARAASGQHRIKIAAANYRPARSMFPMQNSHVQLRSLRRPLALLSQMTLCSLEVNELQKVTFPNKVRIHQRHLCSASASDLWSICTKRQIPVRLTGRRKMEKSPTREAFLAYEKKKTIKEVLWFMERCHAVLPHAEVKQTGLAVLG